MLRSNKNEDLRIKKTHKALVTAMVVMLNRRNFNQITVNDLCEEALVSRATFYTHFNDKYDLLKYCAACYLEETVNDIKEHGDVEDGVNWYINENAKLIKNLIVDSNNEVLFVVNEFITSLVVELIKHGDRLNESENSWVLSTFCAGGLLNLLLWQVENKFPRDSKFMNRYMRDLLTGIMDWEMNRRGAH